MKKFFIVALCGVLFSVHASGQRISYSYDSGGNRVLKKIVILSANAKAAQGLIDDEEEETTQIDAVGASDTGIGIKADGDRVTVTVSEAEWQGSATVSVHDASGRQVLTTQSNTRETAINLSEQSTGIYVLTVKTGRRNKTWRIGIQ